jgi:hypothetical protein
MPGRQLTLVLQHVRSLAGAADTSDDAGRKLLRTVWTTGAQSTKEQGLHVVGFWGPPASVTAQLMTEVQHLDYPFRVETVRLPAHKRTRPTGWTGRVTGMGTGRAPGRACPVCRRTLRAESVPGRPAAQRPAPAVER